MKTRIITSAVLIPILFFALYLYKTIAFDFIIALVCFVAVYEAVTAFKFKNGILLFASFIPAIIALIFRDSFGGILYPVIFISLVLIVVYVLANYGKVDLPSVFMSTFLSIVCIVCFSCMIQFKISFPYSEFGYDGVYFIIIGLSASWGGDSMAYFIGRKFGKRKLSPIISPNKSVEGAYGSLLGSVITAVLFTAIYALIKSDITQAPTFLSYFNVIIISVCICNQTSSGYKRLR